MGFLRVNAEEDVNSAVPALGEIGGGIFGLTQIVWFVALGVLLLGAGRREASAHLRDE